MSICYYTTSVVRHPTGLRAPPGDHIDLSFAETQVVEDFAPPTPEAVASEAEVKEVEMVDTQPEGSQRMVASQDSKDLGTWGLLVMQIPQLVAESVQRSRSAAPDIAVVIKGRRQFPHLYQVLSGRMSALEKVHLSVLRTCAQVAQWQKAVELLGSFTGDMPSRSPRAGVHQLHVLGATALSHPWCSVQHAARGADGSGHSRGGNMPKECQRNTKETPDHLRQGLLCLVTVWKTPSVRVRLAMSPCASPQCHAWLIQQTNPDHPVEVGSGVSIGRKDSCRIKVEGKTISGVQCEVKWTAQLQCFQLVDRSSNGTFLNGQSLGGKGEAARLTDGDQVQLTKGWQQNSELQFTFVTSIVKLGTVKVKDAPELNAKTEENSIAHGPVEVPVEPEAVAPPDTTDAPVPGEKVKLQEALAEAEARAASLSAELAQVKEQLSAQDAAPAAAADPEPSEVETERIQLLAQVDEALKEAAREEGICSAHRELMEDSHKVQEGLLLELKELTANREALVQEKRRCEENSTACRAVEKRVQDLAAAKQSDVKDLQQQARGLISEIHIEGTSLSQRIPADDLRREQEGHNLESPAKRCKVLSIDTGTLFAETIALG
eukprot:s1479_g4.t1